MYQVIKLTVHESVEAALQKAFPKPAAAAKRALAKYISVVESLLFDALQRGQTTEQRKLGLYAISLDQLANKGGQIGPRKIRVHKRAHRQRLGHRSDGSQGHQVLWPKLSGQAHLTGHGTKQLADSCSIPVCRHN